MSNRLDKKAIKGTVWAAIDRAGYMAVVFVVNMVLAWLITPENFAIVGVLQIFISICATLLDGGFVSALIQDKDPDQTDYSTTFFWNLAMSGILYALLFAAAPAIENWMSIAGLAAVLRGVGLSLIFNALSLVQTARLRRKLDFRTLAIANLSGAFVGGATAIIAAYQGAGVWSLVIQTVVMALVRSGLLWLLSRWHPSAVFSMASFKRLFGFGGYMAASSLFQDIATNIQGIIIGLRVPVEVGYYNQAEKLDQVTSYTLPNVLVQVLFPYYSTIREDSERFHSTLAGNIRIISYFVVMILCVLIWVAAPLIGRLYGPQWAPAVPYFRIFCVGGLFRCLQNVNFYAVASVGRGRELFRWSFYKWGMLLGLVMFGSIWGVKGIVWATVVSNLNIYLTNAFLVSRYVGYPLHCQLRVIAPGLMVAVVAMALAGILHFYFGVADWIAGIAFACLYLLFSTIFHLKGLTDTVSAMKGLRKS